MFKQFIYDLWRKTLFVCIFSSLKNWLYRRTHSIFHDRPTEKRSLQKTQVETEPASTTVTNKELMYILKSENIGHESKRILKTETGKFFNL